jgi:hypothetical protein
MDCVHHAGLHMGVLIGPTQAYWGGCTLGATGLEDFLVVHELHKVHEFNGCFDPQRDLQLIVEAKRGFIEALHQQNCVLWVAHECFPH